MQTVKVERIYLDKVRAEKVVSLAALQLEALKTAEPHPTGKAAHENDEVIYRFTLSNEEMFTLPAFAVQSALGSSVFRQFVQEFNATNPARSL